MKDLKELLPDTYTRRARLYSFFVVPLPLVLTFLAWYPDGMAGLGILWSLLVWSGGTALIAQVARDWGKRKQARLFKWWGGPPTTQLLRHRSAPNRVILKRRHDQLQALMTDLSLPSPEEEEANPEAADEVYEACVALLRTRTRDCRAYHLVFEENCNYGFRRNLWGLKPLGLAFAIIGAVGVGVLIVQSYIADNASVATLVLACGLINLLLCLAWIFVITPEWVRIPAEAYADQLLTACDALEPTTA